MLETLKLYNCPTWDIEKCLFRSVIPSYSFSKMKLISTLKLIYIAVLWLLSIYVLAIHMSSCCWEMTNLSYIRLINSQRWVARYSGVWNHCQLLLLIIINENVVHLRSKNITHVQSHAWKMQGNFIGPRVVEDLNHLRCNRPKWSLWYTRMNLKYHTVELWFSPRKCCPQSRYQEKTSC